MNPPRRRFLFAAALAGMLLARTMAQAGACPDLSGRYRSETEGELEVEQQGCSFIEFRENHGKKVYSANLTHELHLGPRREGDQGAVVLWSGWRRDTLVLEVVTLGADDMPTGSLVRSVFDDEEEHSLVIVNRVRPTTGPERIEKREWKRVRE
jgi:hypothetical protein